MSDEDEEEAEQQYILKRKLDALKEVSIQMKENPENKTVQLKGVQGFVSLFTGMPLQLEMNAIKKLLGETDSAKRVAIALAKFPHTKLIVYESLVFFAYAATVSVRLRDELYINDALTLTVKAILEWMNHEIIVTTGLGALFHLCSRSSRALKRMERHSPNGNVMVYNLLKMYGSGMDRLKGSKNMSDDILNWLLAIISLFQGNQQGADVLVSSVTECLMNNLDNVNHLYAGCTAIANFVFENETNRKAAIDGGIFQIVTLTLFKYTGSPKACLAAATALTNCCQNDDIAATLTTGDGARTVALMIEQLKVGDYELNSVILNFLYFVASNSSALRFQCKKLGVFSLIEKASLRFADDVDFQSRASLARDALEQVTEEGTVLEEEQLQLEVKNPALLKILKDAAENSSTEEKDELKYEYYREEATGRRMVVGMNRKPKTT